VSNNEAAGIWMLLMIEFEFTEQAEILKKLQEAEKRKLRHFRSHIEQVISKFAADDTQSRHTFPPMDQTQRSVVQDVIDVAGLTSHSFGIDGVDRHIVVFKSDSLPSDDELAAMRRGEVYDPEQVRLRKEAEQAELQSSCSSRSSRKREPAPAAANYQEKYVHLIGKDAGKSAAQATVTNKQFGYVPSANKKDQRSIEQTLEDIRKKKRQKTDADAQD
jgi:hypothetical protein